MEDAAKQGLSPPKVTAQFNILKQLGEYQGMWFCKAAQAEQKEDVIRVAVNFVNDGPPAKQLEAEFSTNAPALPSREVRALPAPAAEPEKQRCVNYPRHPAFIGPFCKECAREADARAIHGMAADRVQ